MSFYLVFTRSGADYQIITSVKTHNPSGRPCWTGNVKLERMPGMLFWGVESTFFPARFTSLPPTVFLHIWTNNRGAFPRRRLDDMGQLTSARFVESTWSEHTINRLVSLTGLLLKSVLEEHYHHWRRHQASPRMLRVQELRRNVSAFDDGK